MKQKKQPVKVGDYVEGYFYCGRVFRIDERFEGDDRWFKSQSRKYPESAKDERWVSFLCKGGGCAYCPESDVRVCEPFALNNGFELGYFGKEGVK